MSENLITIKNCRIQNKTKTFLQEINWEFKKGEAWLVTGPNGSGKADFIKALAGQLDFAKNSEGNSE